MTATRDNLCHGYSFDDLWTIARNSASANRFGGHDHYDLIVAAFDEIVDVTLASDRPPSERDLYVAGKTGIQRLVRGERQAYGFKNRDGFAGLGSAPMFAKFWTLPAVTPYEDRIVERLANEQIWLTLSARDRSVLIALAVKNNYTDAAASLGMPVGSYKTYISTARKRYLESWHEHETPVRRRGYNRRHHNVDRQPCGTYAALRRHRLYREHVDEACRLAGLQYERRRRHQRAQHDG